VVGEREAELEWGDGPSLGKGTFDRIQRFRDGIAAIRQSWDQLSVTKSLCLADQYLQNRTNIAILFNQLDFVKFIALLSHADECKGTRGYLPRHNNTACSESIELGEQDKVPVFVNVRQSVQSPNRIVPAFCRVYFVEDYFGKLFTGPLYRSKISGVYQALPCLVDRKTGSAVGVLQNVENFTGGVVECRSENLDGRSSQHNDIRVDMREFADSYVGLNKIDVSLDGDDIRVSFDVALNAEIELVDVMVGPLDL
jgi:hypothetical protein